MGTNGHAEDVEKRGAPINKDVAQTDGSGQLEEDFVPRQRRVKLLSATLCLLGTELCERMAFLGLATNMSLYLKLYMGYTAANASQLLQVFKGTAYLTPLIGGFLADAYFGRFRTILGFSLIYMAGLVGLTAINLAPRMQPRLGAPPLNGYPPTVAAFWVFMYLIALGSGGIKPCVSSFGGDQFRDSSVTERRYRSSFFNWFYFVINLGSLIAAIVVTPVQEMRGYGIGFGIPAALFLVSLLVFVAGAALRLYTHVPPEGSPLRRVFYVFKRALVTNRRQPVPADPSQLHEPPLGKGNVAFRMGWTPRYRRLEKAALPHGRPGRYQPTLTEVEETKALLSLGPMLLVGVLFRIGCDPVSTLMPFTGDGLQRQLGAIHVPAASMSFANQLAMLLSLLAYDFLAVPFAARRGRRVTAVQRIAFGICIQVLALLSAGFIELARYRIIAREGLAEAHAEALTTNPKALASEFTVPMSIWWHVIPHSLEGISETFVNAAAVEIFFTQVSEGTRSLANSMLLLAVGIGSYLAFAMNKIVAAGTRGDPWISQNPLKGHYDWYMFLNAVLEALVALLFILWAGKRYKERPIADGEPMSMVELKLCADAGEDVVHSPRRRAAGAAAVAAANPFAAAGVGAYSDAAAAAAVGAVPAVAGQPYGGGFGSAYDAARGGGGGGGLNGSFASREASGARMLSESAPASARVPSELLSEVRGLGLGGGGAAGGPLPHQRRHL